jgi:hypothetical protein
MQDGAVKTGSLQTRVRRFSLSGALVELMGLIRKAQHTVEVTTSTFPIRSVRRVHWRPAHS